jgi:quercetin dioxygenase-like cupin family protein
MSIHVIKQGRAGTPAELRTATFTGTVWGDPVLAETDGVTINTVSFSPGARTHWHSHDGGQVLVVTSGLGRVAGRDGEGSAIAAGDVVFIPPKV